MPEMSEALDMDENPNTPREKRQRRPSAASNAWKPKDINALIAIASISFCMMFVTVGSTIGVLTHVINVAAMGQYGKVGTGTGFVGMISIFVYGMRKPLC